MYLCLPLTVRYISLNRIPVGMEKKHTLGAHQELALSVMDANNSLLIAYGCGTGKTAIALMWTLRAIKRADVRHALVICPASLISNWEDAIANLGDFEGVTAEDVDLLTRRVKIRSFQKIYKREVRIVEHRDGTFSEKKMYSLREDVDKRWGVIFVDEAHCIGAHDSRQTKACLTLAKLSKRRYAMSATPFHGGGGASDFSKLYGIGNFIAPDTWPTWSSFCKELVTSYNKWHQPRSYNVEACEEWVQGHGISCRIEDCFDMPLRLKRDIPCPLVEVDVYKDIQKGNILPYGVEITAAGGQYIKMMQICSGSMKINDSKTMMMKCSKDDALADIIEGMDRKLVIFCNFTASVERCASVSRKAGKQTVIFDGHSTRETWRDFQYGDAEVLVCQYRSGGIGIDLDASAYTIFYEPCTSAMIFEQAHGRVYRPGQQFPCTYAYMYTPKTIEEKILATVKSGRDVSNKMLEDWSQHSF